MKLVGSTYYLGGSHFENIVLIINAKEIVVTEKIMSRIQISKKFDFGRMLTYSLLMPIGG